MVEISRHSLSYSDKAIDYLVARLICRSSTLPGVDHFLIFADALDELAEEQLICGLTVVTKFTKAHANRLRDAAASAANVVRLKVENHGA